MRESLPFFDRVKKLLAGEHPPPGCRRLHLQRAVLERLSDIDRPDDLARAAGVSRKR